MKPASNIKQQLNVKLLPFLPGDDADSTDPAALQVTSTTAQDLSDILRLPAPQFWRALQENPTIITCLDSFLRFSRRSHDGFQKHTGGSSRQVQQLGRRVFQLLWRMSSTGEPNGPTSVQQATLLYDNWLLDVPKLMDVAVLFGSDNPEPTRQLLAKVFQLQPRYLDDVAGVVPPLLDNLEALAMRCRDVAGKVALGEGQLASALEDALQYLQDTALTLSAFVELFPPAGGLLLRAAHGALLPLLASLHDQLLPRMAAALHKPPALAALHTDATQVLRWVFAVEVALQSLVSALLKASFLEGTPSTLDTSQTAEQRGEGLVSALMTLAHSGDADIAGLPASVGGGGSPLLRALCSRFRLDDAIAAASHAGHVAVDDAQLDYVAAMLGSSRARLTAVEDGPSTSTGAGGSSSSRSNGAGPGPSSSGAGTSGAGPSGSGSGGGGSSSSQSAALASQILAVKEVLPEYGDGFITACLHHCGYNTEQVLHHLLEGSLPAALAQLDHNLATWIPPGADPKGKGKMAAQPPSSPGPSSNGLSWEGLAREAQEREAAAVAAASAASAAVASTPSWSTAVTSNTGRRVAKGTARILSAVTEDVRAITRSMGDALSWEYEDEYDDSFDDLMGVGKAGLADMEGDDDVPDPRSSGRGMYDDEPSEEGASSQGFRGGASGRFGSAGPSGRAGASAGGRGPGLRAPTDFRQTSYSDGSSSSTARASIPRTDGPARGQDAVHMQAGGQSRAAAPGGPGQASSWGNSAAPPGQAGGQSSWPAGPSGSRGQGAAPMQTGGQSSWPAGPSGSRGQGAAPLQAGGQSRGAAPGGAGPSASSWGQDGVGRAVAAAMGTVGSSRPPPGDAGRGGRGRGRDTRGKLWVLDGRIYNYKKEGAVEVGGQAEAEDTLQAEREAAQAILGLGAGGNKAYFQPRQQPKQQQDGEGEEDGEDEQWPSGQPPGGRGGRGPGPSGGRGRGSFDSKEKNKAVVGNHHRKDRAFKKMGLM